MSHHDADHIETQTWRERLDALLLARMHEPFAWGTNDCCMFAADAALAVTGTDFAVAERGGYATAFSALSRILALGGLSKIADSAGVRIAPAFAMYGDIGLVDSDGQEMLAVCAGTCWLSPSKVGLTNHDLSAATIAWRLPRG